jgi:Family of unknown function (DUF6130)
MTTAHIILMKGSVVVGVMALLAMTVAAQTAKDVKGATPLVAVANEPSAQLIVDAPIPEQLNATSSPNVTMIDWKYLNGSRATPTAGTASATVTFAAPATAGTYNLRFFAKDTFSLIATSGTVTVQGSTSAASVTATPSAVASGATETVTIANGPGNTRDWVGLYAAGSGNTALIDWKYLNGQKAAPTVPVPSATVTFAMTVPAGNYNVRLFSNDSFMMVAASSAVAVQTGSTINVPAGGDFQSALNNAHPGDTILLAAGATYVGNFVLPVKSGASMITIRSAAPDSALPSATTRIDPSYAPVLPKLKSPIRSQRSPRRLARITTR